MSDMTYTLRADRFVQPAGAIPVTPATYFNYERKTPGLMGLFNGIGSNKVLSIRSIDFCFNHTADMTTSDESVKGNTFRMCRITTAPTGDEDLSVIKMDSSASALPAQITVKKYPGSVPTSAIFNSFCFSPAPLAASLFENGQDFFPLAGGGGFGAPNWGNGGDIEFKSTRGFYGDIAGTSQKITLNADQGILIYAAGNPVSMACQMVLEFKTADGTYNVLTDFYAEANDQPLFSLWNGTGSGKTIEIVKISFQSIAFYARPGLLVYRIDGLYDGIPITPIPMDSTNDAIPSQVISAKHPLFTIGGARSGMNFMSDTIHTSPQNPLWPPITYWQNSASGTGRGPRTTNISYVPYPIIHPFYRPNPPLELPEGYGLVIAARKSTRHLNFDIAITFTMVANSGAPAAVTTSFTYSS